MKRSKQVISLILSVFILGTALPAQIPASEGREIESYEVSRGTKIAITGVRAKKKKITVWYKSTDANIAGYEIRIRTGEQNWRTFATTQTKITIKKLKRKRYYTLQVRVVKLIGERVIYGNWSQEKTVKVK